MLYRKLMHLIILALGLCLPLSTFAAIDTIFSYAAKDFTLSGPADASQYASVIQNWGSRSPSAICNSAQVTYDLARIDYMPMLSYTGRTYQATSAHQILYLYDFGFSGLAMTPLYRANFFNQGEMSATESYLSIHPKAQTVWSGLITNDKRASSSFRLGYQLYLYKDAFRLSAGTHVIPPTDLYRLSCIDSQGVVKESVTVRATGFTINSSVTACVPVESNVVIQMNEIPLSKVEEATLGVLLETQSRRFSVTCPKGINVFVSVTDLVDPSNYGGVVTKLTPDSTAKGVGYVVSSSAIPTGWPLSPPGSASGIPGLTQYYLGESTIDGTNLNLNLNFSYTKTENQVLEGTAKSVVGLTYSYQ